jgi:hypothetical protein
MLRFLYRCRCRLDTLGFDAHGPIYQAIDKAYCGVHDLHMKLHYESLAHGVGNRRDEATESASPADQAQEPQSQADA